jgi:hypothetical protein
VKAGWRTELGREWVEGLKTPRVFFIPLMINETRAVGFVFRLLGNLTRNHFASENGVAEKECGVDTALNNWHRRELARPSAVYGFE